MLVDPRLATMTAVTATTLLSVLSVLSTAPAAHGFSSSITPPLSPSHVFGTSSATGAIRTQLFASSSPPPFFLDEVVSDTVAGETEGSSSIGSDDQGQLRMPSHSPATSLENQVFKWRGYDVRYQVSGPPDADHALVLVHGLFVNSDHWRKALTELNDNDGGKKYRICALDLLGSGWSSKPRRDDPDAVAVDGENGRFQDCDSVCYREQQNSGGDYLKKVRSEAILTDVPLGTAGGGIRTAPSLELRHPLRSPYNFYTWAEQIADFTREVVLGGEGKESKKVTLVANSIGTMSSLQSILDEPSLYDGLFVINPNFRELHMAEVPLTSIAMPVVRQVQSLLRTKGHPLFKALAKKDTVAQILAEPYHVTDAIDDELVDVLLDPLLTTGADDVVFDTLSYSSGPLPEQQLSSPLFPRDSCPVWVTYGMEDPWTPPARVEQLRELCGDHVERIVALDGAGHCPHDERPDLVNPLLLEFLDRIENGGKKDGLRL